MLSGKREQRFGKVLALSGFFFSRFTQDFGHGSIPRENVLYGGFSPREMKSMLIWSL